MTTLEDFNDSSSDQERIIEDEDIPDKILNTTIEQEQEEILEDDAPLFVLEQVKFNTSSEYVDMVAANQIIFIAFKDNKIMRLNLEDRSKITNLDFIPKKEENSIRKLFLDPYGAHLIINCTNGDNYYYYNTMEKPKILSKLKGISIESVAWNTEIKAPQRVTQEILIGDSKGTIYETSIDKKELYLKQLYQLEEQEPITGMYFQRYNTNSDLIFVIVTTPNRLREFIGKKTLEAVFEKYMTVKPGFHPFLGKLNYSELHIQKEKGYAHSFSWLTQSGIYHGTIDTSKRNIDPEKNNVISNASFVPYLIPTQANPPLSFVQTDYHFLFVFPEEFAAVCKLNQDIVVQLDKEFFDISEIGKLKAFAHDFTGDIIWLFSERGFYRIFVNNEKKDIWKIYLNQKQFEMAIESCSNDYQRNQVYKSQAKFHYANQEYNYAAALYAKTNIPFEKIVLKFLNIDNNALKDFLTHKIDAIGEQDFTQLKIICAWLTEIYLSSLNQIHLKIEELETEKKPKNEIEKLKEQFKQTLQDFKYFLVENKRHLNPEITYEMISKHGRIDILLDYALSVGDFERVISHHIQNENYKEALKVIQGQKSDEIIYKYSPILMNHLPVETVDLWILKASNLNTVSLLPAIMRYDPAKNPSHVKSNQAIRYLEFCVKQLHNRDPTIHNFLLALYASNNQDSELLNFLNMEIHQTFYDLKYALRLCTKYRKKDACVYIYSQMGLYEEAVDLALNDNYMKEKNPKRKNINEKNFNNENIKNQNDIQFEDNQEKEIKDIKLATINALKPEDDDLKKQLLLKIARDLMEKQKNIKKAIEFIDEHEQISIEDLLPLFPNSVKIDDFKDQIKKTLDNYISKIRNLKQEMDSTTKSTDIIREDIKLLRDRYSTINPNPRCDLCGTSILNKDFCFFNCGHLFHTSCLQNELLEKNLVSNSKKKRILELNQMIINEQSKHQSDNKNTNQNQPQKPSIDKTQEYIQHLKLELHKMITFDCVICGEVVIKTIDMPFFDEENQSLINSWKI